VVYHVGWALLLSIDVPNLKSLAPPVTKTGKPPQKVETGWFAIVRGHSRLLEIVRYWLKVADFNLPHLYLAPPLGWRYSNFIKIFDVRKLDSYAITRHRFCDPTFSRFDRTPTCDIQRDRRRDGRAKGDSIYRASIASHGKNWLVLDRVSQKNVDVSFNRRMFQYRRGRIEITQRWCVLLSCVGRWETVKCCVDFTRRWAPIDACCCRSSYCLCQVR